MSVVTYMSMSVVSRASTPEVQHLRYRLGQET